MQLFGMFGQECLIQMKVIRAFFKVKQFKGVVPVRFYGKDRIRSWQGTDSLIHRTSYNVYLKNAQGDVLGEIDGIAIG